MDLAPKDMAVVLVVAMDLALKDMAVVPVKQLVDHMAAQVVVVMVVVTAVDIVPKEVDHQEKCHYILAFS